MEEGIWIASIVWSFIALIILGRPIAKGVAERLSAQARPVDDARLRALEVELRAHRIRLEEAERQIAGGVDRLAFVEDLLAHPAQVEHLAPPTHREPPFGPGTRA